MRQSLIACVVACVLVAAHASAARAATATTGTVTAFDGTSITIETPGRQSGVLDALYAAADAITREDLPYVWGGGHDAAGTPSLGEPGPGYTGHTAGYDCSGAVAAVLVGAGLWPAGTSVPNDAGVIDDLLSEGLIAPGVGTGAEAVTLYDDPGVHIFMNLDGRYFGTSDGRDGNALQPLDGAGWLDDGAPDAMNRAFRRYHLVRSVLGSAAHAGRSVTFELGTISGVLSGFAVGEHVAVSYREAGSGSLFATRIALLQAGTASGSIAAIGRDGGSLALTLPDGLQMALKVTRVSGLTDGLTVGDDVEVVYTTTGGARTARAIQLIAPATSTAGSGTTPATAAGGLLGTGAPGAG